MSALNDYLRPFTNAISQAAQLAHLHRLAHYTLNQLETLEATMATQDDINKIADQINTAVADLTSEIAAIRDANPAVDLTGLQSAVGKLSDLDTANAATAETSAPVDTTTDAPASTDTTTVDAPVDAPVVDDSADTTPADAPQVDADTFRA